MTWNRRWWVALISQLLVVVFAIICRDLIFFLLGTSTTLFCALIKLLAKQDHEHVLSGGWCEECGAIFIYPGQDPGGYVGWLLPDGRREPVRYQMEDEAL